MTYAGQPARFHAQERDPEVALTMAKTLAAVECGDLLVVLAGQGTGVEFVPAERVAGYVLPIHPPNA